MRRPEAGLARRGDVRGVLGYGGAPMAPAPGNYGDLRVVFDAAQAVESGGFVASVGAGAGLYAHENLFAAPNRPTLTGSNPLFNGRPSMRIGETVGMRTIDPVSMPGVSLVTLVAVVRLGSSGGAAIIDTSGNVNAHPSSVTMIHGLANMRSNKCAPNGNTIQRNRDVADVGVNIIYAMEYDLASGLTTSMRHWQDGSERVTNLGFDNGINGGGTIATHRWHFGCRDDGSWYFYDGHISWLGGYAGAVDHAALFADWLDPTFNP